VATAGYYRKQAQTCLDMSRVCRDPILAEHLGSLANEFMEAAADQDPGVEHDAWPSGKRGRG
jgi:hypothetical protein